ncbi:hypothetical protein TNIN_285541 [Trichonephila inaurata madagascariensis]|uniref:Uncharacterized protein n=1 Tax=Trichonephila inaurata madagascariensis TaxID=2747483 RepID=A0A8X6Y3Z9_9ARAC|nr:hypothetical protein TNIN_285541 [Trichonephila inaurata madagascariensis]
MTSNHVFYAFYYDDRPTQKTTAGERCDLEPQAFESPSLPHSSSILTPLLANLKPFVSLSIICYSHHDGFAEEWWTT